ncbi:MAG: hypothetical protein M0R03_23030 [Novosphingobium sp.]|nr:hypothetical protein [Novosphingobium sp.]
MKNKQSINGVIDKDIVEWYLTDDESEWGEWWYNLYMNEADMYEWEEFVGLFRTRFKIEGVKKSFNLLWQNHTLLNHSPEAAIQECADVIIGDY